MTKRAKHTRIPSLPYIDSLSGARLVGFHEEMIGKRYDLVVDYDEFCPGEPAAISNENGKIVEWVSGSYIPRRLRFFGVLSVVCQGLFTKLDNLPMDHEARSLRGVLSWIVRNDQHLFSIFDHGAEEPARLWVTARGCRQEARGGASEVVEILRDWSPPPNFRAGLIPDLKRFRKRYSGDPVTIRLGGQVFHERLFVGDLECQTEQRPLVDAVLNVGEEPSRWVKNGEVSPADRWVVRGEGSQGMSVEELTEEANWVIERLRQGQRVLIHCVAGLNRSTSVCCAVLILTEGLSAEAVLARVRERHAWARPDEHHWLMLQWMAKQIKP